MEVLTWLASLEAVKVSNGSLEPIVMFHEVVQETGVGFGIVEAAS